MWKWMRGAAVLGASLLLSGMAAFGQATPNAKACALLPIAELEALFGAKATTPKGADGSTMSLCSVNFGGVRNRATVNIQPPSPTDQAMSIEQRLDMLKKAGGKGFESKVFGSVGCFHTGLEMGEKPLPVTTCFQTSGGYLAVEIGSDQPKQVSFETVKGMLEKAATRRK